MGPSVLHAGLHQAVGGCAWAPPRPQGPHGRALSPSALTHPARVSSASIKTPGNAGFRRSVSLGHRGNLKQAHRKTRVVSLGLLCSPGAQLTRPLEGQSGAGSGQQGAALREGVVSSLSLLLCIQGWGQVRTPTGAGTDRSPYWGLASRPVHHPLLTGP